MDDKQSEGEKVDVNIGGSGSAAPAAPPAEPEAPSAPPEPGLEEEPGAEPEIGPAPAPPSPGSVVTSGDGTIGGPPQQVVTSGGSGGKRWLKRLLILVLIAALAAGGWFAYNQWFKKEPAAPATTQSKDIPILKIGIKGADYGQLYPDMTTSAYAYLANTQVFEGLVRYEDKNKIAPNLATDWKNPDDKTWVFTIRKGVKFHDGNIMTAKDVKYSLDKITADSESELAQTFASTIASVEVVGDDQVKITTTDPDPTLLNKLAFLYVIDANLPKGSEPSQAGTGPYQIKSGTKPTSTSLQMVAFDGYHDGRPTTRALTFGSVEGDKSLLKAFTGGQYNITGPMSPDVIGQAKNATRFVSTEPDVNFIAFNTVKPGPLQKKLVRQAIRYAVDPKAIGKANGSQTTPLSQLIPPSIPGYNPAIPGYERDVDKAKQLLKQAGYPKGLTLRLSLSDPTDNKQLTKEITNELKQAGITVAADQHDDFGEFIDYFIGGQAEMYTVDYSSDTLDGLDIYQTILADTNYNNPELTKLLDEASTTVDPASRLKLLQDAAVIINNDVPVVPLSTQDDLWLMDKDYAIKQDMPSLLISAYFYKVQLK